MSGYIIVCAVDGDNKITAARREATEELAQAALTRVQAEYPNAFYTDWPGGDERDFIVNMNAGTIQYDAAGVAAREAAANAVAYRPLRQRDYIADLSDGAPVPLEAIGDTIDDIMTEVADIRAEVGGQMTAGFADKLAKRDAVKARHPKPEPVARPETP